MATLPGLRTSLTLDSAAFDAGVRSVTSSVDRLGRQVTQQNATMQRGFGAVGTAANALKGAIIGLVGAFSAEAIVRMGKNALDTAGGLGELAQQAGVTARELQILSLAGVQAGVGQQQLINSLAQFGKRVGEAAQGTGTLLKTLEQYSIDVKDATGNTRTSVAVLGDVAEAVQNAGSAQEQLRIAQAALGREGAKLLPILVKGREGLAAIAEQAEAAGLIIGDELVAQADRASDAIATLQVAATAGFQIGVIKAFGDAVSASTDSLTRAREAGELFGTAVGTALNAVAQAASFIGEHFDEIKAALAGLVAFKAATFFLDMATGVAAAAKAMGLLNVALVANPFGLVAIAIGAVVAALVLYRNELVTVGDVTFRVGDTLTAAWIYIRDAIGGALEGVANMATALGKLVTLDFAGAFESATASVEDFGRSFNAPVAAIQAFNDAAAKTQAEVARTELGPLASDTQAVGAAAGEAAKQLATLEEQVKSTASAGGGGANLAGAQSQAASAVGEIAQEIAKQGDLSVASTQTMVDGIKDLLGNQLPAAFEAARPAIEGTKQLFRDLYEDVVGRSSVPDLIEGIEEWFSRLNRIMIDPAETATSGVSDAFQRVLQDAQANQRALLLQREALTTPDAPGAGGEDWEQRLQFARDAIDLEEQLRAAQATRNQAEHSDLLETLKLNQAIRSENEKLIEQQRAVQDLSETIEDQKLLLAYAGQQTEEYRVQQNMRELARDTSEEFAASQLEQIKLLEKQRTQLEQLTTIASSFENAMLGAFRDVTSGAIKSFGDLADKAKEIFINLAQTITEELIIKPALEPVAQQFAQFFAGGGPGGAGSLAEQSGLTGASAGLTTAGTTLTTAGTALNASAVALQASASAQGAAGAVGAAQPALATQLVSGPGRPPTTAGMPGTAGSAALQPQAAGGGGFLSSFFPYQGFTGAGLLGGGLLGVGVGQTYAGVTGQTGTAATGATVGGVAGGAIGSIYGPLGTLIGSAIGSAVGGLAGSVFGGGGQDMNEVTIGRLFGRTGGTSAAAQFVEQLDQQIMDLLTQEQIKQANKFIDDVTVEYDKILDEAAKKAIAKERIGAAAQALGFRQGAITGAGDVDAQLQALQQAIATQEAIQDLTSGMGDFERQAQAITERFDELRQSAKEFGISTTGLRKAQREAGLEFITQQLRQLTGLTPTFAQQLRELKDAFKDLAAAAEELGLSTEDVEEAQQQATAALRQAQRQQINQLALSIIEPFEQLRSPLQAFQTQLNFAGMNPLQQLQAAQADFDRIAALAQAGNTDAIQQLTEAADLFIRLSEQVGASPAAAAAREQVAAVINEVLRNIDQAQADATKGLGNLIKQASAAEIDTLKELIEASRDIADEIRRLRRAS